MLEDMRQGKSLFCKLRSSLAGLCACKPSSGDNILLPEDAWAVVNPPHPSISFCVMVSVFIMACYYSGFMSLRDVIIVDYDTILGRKSNVYGCLLASEAGG